MNRSKAVQKLGGMDVFRVLGAGGNDGGGTGEMKQAEIRKENEERLLDSALRTKGGSDAGSHSSTRHQTAKGR